MTTTHHQTDHDMGKLLRRRIDRFGHLLQSFPARRSNLGLASTDALEALGAALHQRSDHAAVLRCLRFARDCALAVMRISQDKPGSETVAIDGCELALARVGPWSQGHCAHWKTAFFGSVLLRDDKASEWLARFPLGILRASETTSQEYGYTMVEALQSFRLDRHGWNDLAARSLAQGESDPESDDWNREVGLPILRVFASVYADSARLNQVLAEALDLHVRWYTRGDNRNDPRGFFSLPLAALASWAHDCRREITVDSDYIPLWLVQGRFE